jgi:hypothetical protein
LFGRLLLGKAIVEVAVVGGEAGSTSESVVIGREEKTAEEQEERR